MTLLWEPREARDDGAKVSIWYLIDSTLRIYAYVQKGQFGAYNCVLYFSPSGAADGKPTWEEDRSYLELLPAQQYCEKAALSKFGGPE